MIAVRLMGGLGNQLFQYAAGRRLAERLGTELVLDVGWFRHEGSRLAVHRDFELGSFGLDFRIVELEPGTVARWEARRWRRPKGALSVVRQRENDNAVDERVLDARDDTLLIGYWQSERYFADVRDLIRGDLALDNGEDATAVSVHVRRGDYAATPVTRQFHGLLGEDYYRRALELVRGRVPDARVLAYSDDPEWVREHLDSCGPLTLATTGNAHEDLRAMSGARHHVVANSSFSWWAAWLGERDDSVVVAPQAWFAAESVEEGDIVPSRWTRL